MTLIEGIGCSLQMGGCTPSLESGRPSPNFVQPMSSVCPYFVQNQQKYKVCPDYGIRTPKSKVCLDSGPKVQVPSLSRFWTTKSIPMHLDRLWTKKYKLCPDAGLAVTGFVQLLFSLCLGFAQILSTFEDGLIMDIFWTWTNIGQRLDWDK